MGPRRGVACFEFSNLSPDQCQTLAKQCQQPLMYINAPSPILGFWLFAADAVIGHYPNLGRQSNLAAFFPPPQL
jgi:hypothetical protein